MKEQWIRGESNPYRRVASAVLSQLSYRPEETRCHESGSNRRRPGLQPSALPAELSRQRRRPSRVRRATPRRGLEPLSSARQADCDARRITRQITRARRARCETSSIVSERRVPTAGDFGTGIRTPIAWFRAKRPAVGRSRSGVDPEGLEPPVPTRAPGLQPGAAPVPRRIRSVPVSTKTRHGARRDLTKILLFVDRDGRRGESDGAPTSGQRAQRRRFTSSWYISSAVVMIFEFAEKPRW